MSDIRQFTRSEISVLEGGFYGQLAGIGLYGGYGSNGIAIGGLWQASAGVAVYTSAGFTWSVSDGLQGAWNAGVGAAVPTGVPITVTVH